MNIVLPSASSSSSSSSSHRPPNSMNHPPPLRSWSVEQVAQWVVFSGYPSLADAFRTHEIDGQVLPQLTDDLLADMDVETSLRGALLSAIALESQRQPTALASQPNNAEEALAAAAKTEMPSSPRPKETAAPPVSPTASRSLIHLYSDGPEGNENMDTIYASVDRYGFFQEEDDPSAVVADFSDRDAKRSLEKELEREQKWIKMAGGSSEKFSLKKLEENPKFRVRVYKGIPDKLRIQMWLLLTINGDIDSQPEKIEYYKKMTAIEANATDENQIDLDINRTLRNHVAYKQRYGPGQKRLFNVLRAYANHNPEVGFCQGMGTVAAFLLLYCKEETSFWIMDSLVTSDRFRLKGLWSAGFPMLMEAFFIHDKLLKFHLPKLFKHFKNQSIHPSSYATRWYMTIFLGFPFHTCLRIWDVFLAHGFDILFFFAIATLDMFQNELLMLEFEGIMEFLGNMAKKAIDDDKLIRTTIRVIRKTNMMANLRNEYQKQGGAAAAESW